MIPGPTLSQAGCIRHVDRWREPGGGIVTCSQHLQPAMNRRSYRQEWLPGNHLLLFCPLLVHLSRVTIFTKQGLPLRPPEAWFQFIEVTGRGDSSFLQDFWSISVFRTHRNFGDTFINSWEMNANDHTTARCRAILTRGCI